MIFYINVWYKKLMSTAIVKIIEDINYIPPFFFGNGHVQSIYPTIFRKVDAGFYRRERIITDDDDFLDLDWAEIKSGTNRCAIISHGLEGDTHRAYVAGMAKALNSNGWDALAWNYRTCSGETNRQFRLYHNGVTDDLDRVVNHAKSTGRYTEIALVGFSLGGNLSLLYLGHRGGGIDPIIKKAAVFSVPCHLKTSSDILARPSNIIYMKRFLILLHKKIRAKMELFPGRINDNGYWRIRDFRSFDDRYTAPIHGFRDALDYWEKCSSKPHIPKITVPTLIVNAKNDPFLSPECFPVEEARANKNIFLKMPESGGHVGFVEFNKENVYWSEKIAALFLNED